MQRPITHDGYVVLRYLLSRLHFKLQRGAMDISNNNIFTQAHLVKPLVSKICSGDGRFNALALNYIINAAALYQGFDCTHVQANPIIDAIKDAGALTGACAIKNEFSGR